MFDVASPLSDLGSAGAGGKGASAPAVGFPLRKPSDGPKCSEHLNATSKICKTNDFRQEGKIRLVQDLAWKVFDSPTALPRPQVEGAEKLPRPVASHGNRSCRPLQFCLLYSENIISQAFNRRQNHLETKSD